MFHILIPETEIASRIDRARERHTDSEDSFELHSVDLELEAVEKQIRDLQVKQAQLRQRKAALESSRTDAHLSQVPAILKKNIGAVVLHAGTNDIRLRQMEILKKDFRSLVELVRTTSPTTRIIVSGPLPTFQREIERKDIVHITLSGVTQMRMGSLLSLVPLKVSS
ncbi:hypothetical protein QTP86_010108 [Hemibagrus guttatus]|nr:hypothetical protein QTP86_010108 [Hemibagrus guttatus]